jgi:hypothetical protein
MDSRFIGEPMVPVFHTPPPISKKPHCPNGFIWGDEAFHVQAVLEEWKDYQRRGRMRSNMRPANQAKAAKRGSWGVGRFYFRVRVQNGRCFEFYYDRSPKDSDDRYGAWFLTRELFYEQ